MIARADDDSNTAPEPSYADAAETFRPYAPDPEDEYDIRERFKATAPAPIRRRKGRPFVWARPIYDEPPFDRDSAIPF